MCSRSQCDDQWLCDYALDYAGVSGTTMLILAEGNTSRCRLSTQDWPKKTETAEQAIYSCVKNLAQVSVPGSASA